MALQFARLPGTVEPILGAITTITEFKELIGSALGVMVVLSFLFGVVAFTVGIVARGRDPEMSKWAFLTAFLLALAVPAVTLMFSAAGLGSAVVEPRF